MKLLAILVLCLAWAVPASAQTLPPTGQLYFTGTTEELDDIRAAVREAECLRIGPLMEMCIQNGQSSNCTMEPNPYCGTNEWPTGGQGDVLEPSFGVSGTDCMTAFASFISQDLGTTVLVGEQEVYIPAEEELADDAALPQACADYLLDVYCPVNYSMWWCHMGCAPPC